ncbi:hypothetical protein EPUS_06514 [Endocarpon pusillum Z07020]|uniref:Serine hydrolase domain-containing protein n=1 Tax=Endocarpon pusillum (strain Z07020 / HMAS-L-300199) TaxID=1263415 RepID=U1HNL1_ENDPU|nr:uncharacterized protein EPUS_06514 [Endocarpon pusillum Z07020]ERF71955.1 hypothetical protein EPUS_06514 [Endocarpon pusillum Z07020]
MAILAMQSRESSSGKKRKVLCLHGIGTNSEMGQIFEAQTAALRYRLGPAFEYDFIEGSYPWPAAPGIREIFGAHDMCYSYHDGSAPSALEAVQSLSEYCRDNSPYAAVMGFSSGAALAATLLIAEAGDEGLKKEQQATFGSAIFLCSTQPYDWRELKAGRVRFLDGQDASEAICIPTVHAWARNDKEYAEQGVKVVQMSKLAKRTEVIHNAGHGVPNHGEALERLAVAVERATSGLA